MSTPLAQRLHHNAYVTRDQEATRAFYEDLLGLPLLATWSEADELFGAVRVYCHTFFGLGDGSALAFFQFADPGPGAVRPRPARRRSATSPWRRRRAPGRHPAPPDGRRLEAGRTFVLEHGYCRSLYTQDPNGLLLEFTVDHPEADDIAAVRAADAHDTLQRWLGGDHTSNNTYR